MKALRLALAVLLCTAPLLAAAEWQWLDKDGRRVFSDQSPPPDVPANRILKQPGQRGSAAATTTAADAAAPASAPAAGKDKNLEAKKKEADVAAAAQKRTQEEQAAQARADNCARAKSGKATYDSGVRVVRTNDKGEREYLSDEERNTEMKRLNGIIATDCK